MVHLNSGRRMFFFNICSLIKHQSVLKIESMFKPSYIRKRSVIVDRECIQKVQIYYTFTYHVYTSLLSLLFPTPLIDGVAIFSQIFLSLFEPFDTSCAQNYNRKFITQCKKRIGYERHWDSRLITPCKKRTGYERHWNYLNNVKSYACKISKNIFSFAKPILCQLT